MFSHQFGQLFVVELFLISIARAVVVSSHSKRAVMNNNSCSRRNTSKRFSERRMGNGIKLDHKGLATWCKGRLVF